MSLARKHSIDFRTYSSLLPDNAKASRADRGDAPGWNCVAPLALEWGCGNRTFPPLTQSASWVAPKSVVVLDKKQTVEIPVSDKTRSRELDPGSRHLIIFEVDEVFQ